MNSINAFLLYPVIIFAGVLQAFGPPMNGQLRQSLVNPWVATLVSFGLIVALPALCRRRKGLPGCPGGRRSAGSSAD